MKHHGKATWTVAVMVALGCQPASPLTQATESSPDEMASGGVTASMGGTGGGNGGTGGATLGSGASGSEELLPVLEVRNPMTLERLSEVVEIGIDPLRTAHPELFDSDGFLGPTRALDQQGGELPTQTIDLDADGSAEWLLVQMDLGPGETRRVSFDAFAPSVTPAGVHARFVPERLDDFAWENDRTVYRTYGPALASSGQTSGSGIDVWVKSTSELVLDAWYALDDYHVDHGQGLDGYQVGTSRGAGGTALWTDGGYVSAGVFSSWEILAAGPIRTVFELQYEGVPAGAGFAQESKRFSLDRGSWFTRVETVFSGESALEEAHSAAGIAVHAGATTEVTSGSIRVWEPLDGDNGFVGVAVVAEGEVSSSDEEGHVFLMSSAPADEPFVFHIGSAWSKAGVSDAASFDALRDEFVARLAAPLILTWTK